MRPEMKPQIFRKQFICVTDVCAIAKLTPRELLWKLASQTVPYGGTQVTQNSSCQKALCNRCPVQLGDEFWNSRMCVIMLGPIVAGKGDRHPRNSHIWKSLHAQPVTCIFPSDTSWISTSLSHDTTLGLVSTSETIRIYHPGATLPLGTKLLHIIFWKDKIL